MKFHVFLRLVAAGFLSVMVAGSFPITASADTYTVTNTDNLGPGSLRQAILDANSNPGLDTIEFSIPGSGVHTIQPTTSLPTINGPVIIDGLSQSGASSGNLWSGTGHTLLIELDGSLVAGSPDGLKITAGGSTVRGLVIHSFPGYGIFLSTSGSNTIETNYIGTDTNGETDLGNAISGIMLDNVGSNTIGGSVAGAGNLIAGNNLSGIQIQGVTAVSNQIKGNFIGTDEDGEEKIANGQNGIVLDNAPWNVIGGSTSAEGNLISGNVSFGIWISDTYSNRVRGNYIGTTRHGTVQPVDLGNGMDGIYIIDSYSNTIGGADVGQGNLISGNTLHGMRVTGDDARINNIYSNYIGTDKYGTSALANGGDGVNISGGAHNNAIGGDGVGEGNLISGNANNGVSIQNSGSDLNTVEGNLIGTDLTGTLSLGNLEHGIRIGSMAYFNIVGGDTAAERNVISGNTMSGVLITGIGTTYTFIKGNYIGTDISGISALPNSGQGVLIEAGAQESTIGGLNPGEGNVIAFNGADGVRAMGIMTFGNEFTRNRIFGNTSKGIELISSANGGILAPTISATSMGPVTITGTAVSCSGCTIEVFSNPDTDGEGKTYLGSAVVSGTSWSLSVPGIGEPYLTATVTDGTDGTSEFSGVFTSTVQSVFLPLIMK